MRKREKEKTKNVRAAETKLWKKSEKNEEKSQSYGKKARIKWSDKRKKNEKMGKDMEEK